MGKASEVRVILVTAPEKDAVRLAKALLKERLIACANLIKGVRSLYRWKGKMQDDAETLLLLKAPRRNAAKLLKRLKELHSYEVPEFLALQVIESNADYGAWVCAETSAQRQRLT